MDQEKVIVIDFGGQYNQLVARRVRECNVYCEIYSYKIDIEKIKEMNPKGIILTGGPNSCYEENSPSYQKELFELEKGPGYPDTANSDAYLIGKARYKDHDEERAREYEAKYSGKEKQINFEVVNSVSVYEIKKIIQQMREILEK